jgi:hypothetical protein
MHDGLRQVLVRQVESGLADLAGTNFTALIPITEEVLNQLLRMSGRMRRDVYLSIEDANRLVVRYGVFHVAARVAGVTMTPSPLVHLRLSSTVIAWMLHAVGGSWLRIRGRDVSIDLSGASAFGAHRSLWQHVRDMQVTTSPGIMQLHVVFAVR